MSIFLLFIGILLCSHINGQAPNFIFTSYWFGGDTQVQNAISQTVALKECLKPYVFTPYYLTSGLTYFSPLNVLNTEVTILKQRSLRYAFGEENRLLEFIFLNSGSNNVTRIQSIYPNDTEIMKIVISVFNNVTNSFRPMQQNILVIVNRTQDYNNLNINNYENIVRIINEQNWVSVKFLEYTNSDDIVFKIRQQNYFNIISLLYDPDVNKELMTKAFLAHLMVWRYRWIIVDLLGGTNFLNDTTYGQGVLTSNVTIITFAQGGLDGRAILLQSVFNVSLYDYCKESGLLNTLSGSFKPEPTHNRTNFLFVIYQNPGNQMVNLGYSIYDRTSDNVTLPNALRFIDFQMNETMSLKYLQATGFKIGCVNYPPFSYCNPANYSGFIIDLLNNTLKELNVPITIVPLSVSNIGSFYSSNLSFDGILGMVQNGTIDTVSIPVIITNNRLDNFDFATNLLSGYIAGIYKNPTLTGMSALISYIQPFQYYVWIVLLCSAVAIAICLTITDYVYPDKYSRYKILMSVFFSFSSLTHGAYFDPPRKSGGRIIMCFWWMFCLLFVILWIANYTALLAKQNSQQQLTSFSSLLRQNNFMYLTLNDNVLFEYLNNNAYQIPQTIQRIIKDEFPNGTVNSIDAAIQLVKSGSYIFLYDDKALIYYFYSQCLTMFGKFGDFSYGLVLPRHSEKRAIITQRFGAKQIDGNISAIFDRNTQLNNSGCAIPGIVENVTAVFQKLVSDNFIKAFDLNTMMGVFVMVSVGSVCSLILAGFEKCIRLIIQRRMNQRNKYRYENTVEQLQIF